MRLKWKAGFATLTLVLGSLLATARAAQQGPPPDPPGDQGGRPDGHGGPGDHGGRMGMRNRMGQDGRDDADGRDGRWGGGRWGRDGGGRGGRMGMRMGMRDRGGPGEFGLAGLLNNPEVRQQIGVSADQAAKIRQQESDFRKAEIRNRADLQVKRLDLRDLLSADKPDRAAIDSKLQDISTSQLAMEKAAVGHQLDVREALTPAQREKLRQWMMQRNGRERGAERGEAGGQRGPRGGNRAGGARGNAGAGATPPPPSGQSNQAPRQ
jgi:Spy/CpxP family protein refolding chaperone